MILYTFILFKQVKLRHNDLHGGNVLIRQLENDITIKYFIDDKDYYVTTNKIPLIYDYDRSTLIGSQLSQENEQLCDKYGTCNNQVFAYDILVFLQAVANSQPSIINNIRLKNIYNAINHLISLGYQHSKYKQIFPPIGSNKYSKDAQEDINKLDAYYIIQTCYNDYRNILGTSIYMIYKIPSEVEVKSFSHFMEQYIKDLKKEIQ